MTELFVGTSGYSYTAWRGSFYPEKCPPKDMLRVYSESLRTVEINASFYRIPKADTVRAWADSVHDDFRFALKASRRITHNSRLRENDDSLLHFLEVASHLKRKLGPILFQLPPNFKKDIDRLSAFLEKLPPNGLAAFEFRHDSWSSSDVQEVLAAKNVALCYTGGEGEDGGDLQKVSSWGYLRLRKEGYSDSELRDWALQILAMQWSRVFVYFKHEDEGIAPKLAARFSAIFDEEQKSAR